MAVVGDRLAVALAGLDIVRFFDKKTDAAAGRSGGGQARGLAVDAAGTLFAVSGREMVKIADGKVTPVVETELEKPTDVAVDAQGRIYVADPARSR